MVTLGHIFAMCTSLFVASKSSRLAASDIDLSQEDIEENASHSDILSNSLGYAQRDEEPSGRRARPQTAIGLKRTTRALTEEEVFNGMYCKVTNPSCLTLNSNPQVCWKQTECNTNAHCRQGTNYGPMAYCAMTSTKHRRCRCVDKVQAQWSGGVSSSVGARPSTASRTQMTARERGSARTNWAEAATAVQWQHQAPKTATNAQSNWGKVLDPAAIAQLKEQKERARTNWAKAATAAQLQHQAPKTATNAQSNWGKVLDPDAIAQLKEQRERARTNWAKAATARTPENLQAIVATRERARSHWAKAAGELAPTFPVLAGGSSRPTSRLAGVAQLKAHYEAVNQDAVAQQRQQQAFATGSARSALDGSARPRRHSWSV